MEIIEELATGVQSRFKIHYSRLDGWKAMALLEKETISYKAAYDNRSRIPIFPHTLNEQLKQGDSPVIPASYLHHYR
jgi:hypothetical protein